MCKISKARIKLHNAKSIILTDLDKNVIQEFQSMSALGLYLKADRSTLAKYRDNGNLFRGLYYIISKLKT